MTAAETRTDNPGPLLKRRILLLLPWICSAVFLLMALALIPYPGLQNDEIFFASPLYSADAGFFQVQLGHHQVPFMVLSYSGALKTWIYKLIFGIIAPSIWSVRVPVVLAGCGTIWLTWVFVWTLAGARAAAIATVLLATDASFLLTDAFDWGPVALQHVFLMSGLVAMLSWVRTRSAAMLASGCFLWGVGLWDKALMIWPLMALALATLVVYPRETLRRVTMQVVAIALVAALLGAAPLVWFNLTRRGETATTNARFSTNDLRQKVDVLRQTLSGSILFGYMARNDGPGQRAAGTPLEKGSVWLAGVAGDHHKNWLLAAMLIALTAGLLGGNVAQRRLLLFTVIVLVATWALMALTFNAGGAGHHVVLMWPFPFVLVGVGLDAAARRQQRWASIVVAALVATLCVQNVLNVNQYLSAFVRNGSSAIWTDAVEGLSDALTPGSAAEIEVVDWGYLNSVRVLHQGRLRLMMVGDWLAKPSMTPFERQYLSAMMAAPANVFVQHTDDNQMFPDVNAHLRQAAMEMGFREKRERVIHDSNRRPLFEFLRFERAAVSP